MSIRYEVTVPDGFIDCSKSDTDSRMEIDLGDGRYLNVIVTHEGIIMDVYLRGFTPETDTLEGTAGMMFDEWADWVVSR